MTSIPGSFLFVNRTPKSASLSNSTDGDKFFIQIYVQSKCRKSRGRRMIQQASRTQCPMVKSSKLKVSSNLIQCFDTVQESPSEQNPEEVDTEAKKSSQQLLMTRVPRSPITSGTPDPFNSTVVAIDEQTYRLLQYPFSDYVLTTFKAEGLRLMPSHKTNGVVRHCSAIINRMKRCMEDELTMYSTLAYSSSCARWAMGQQQKQRPPEFFLVKAIEALRIRLQESDVVDSWLVLAVYALSVSGLWAKDYEAASMHLRIIRK